MSGKITGLTWEHVITMARRKDPTQLAMRYELTNSATPGTETSHYIDLAKDLSRLNRRLYRQGKVYHVSGIEIVSRNTIAGVYGDVQNGGGPVTATTPDIVDAGFVSVSTAPDTWMTADAWKRGQMLWNKQYEGLEVPKGRYTDYKVYLSDDHRTGTVLEPLDNGGSSMFHGEWAYATYTSPDGTTSSDNYYAHLLGNHVGSAGSWTSIGLIRSFGYSRETVRQDNKTSTIDTDDPLLNLFDDGTVADERLDTLIGLNDQTPYGLAQYTGNGVGSAGNKPHVAHQGAISNGMLRLGAFAAPCGLLELETTSPIANDSYNVLIRLKAGAYKGVAADEL